MALALVMQGFPQPAAAAGMPATAELRDATGAVLGTATLWQAREGVRVDATLHGMAPGSHAAHIHEVGRCDAPAFASAAARFGPVMEQSGMPRPDAHHVGDLFNLDEPRLGSNFRSVEGALTIHGLARGASLGPGPTALLGATGAALLVHAQRDDDVHDMLGEAGGRVACGVVVPGGAASSQTPAPPAVAQDGRTLSGEPPDVQASFRAAYGDLAAAEWAREHDTAPRPLVAPSLEVGLPESPPPSEAPSSECLEPSSDPATACLLSDHSAVSGSAANAGGMHVYRFEVAWSHANVLARLINLATDYDLYLVDQASDVIGQSVQEGTTPETIEMDLPTGTYWLYVNADIGRPMPAKAPYQLLLDLDPSPEGS